MNAIPKAAEWHGSEEGAHRLEPTKHGIVKIDKLIIIVTNKMITFFIIPNRPLRDSGSCFFLVFIIFLLPRNKQVSSFSWVYMELSSTTNSFRLGHITPVTVSSLLYIIDASLAVCFQVGICQYTNLDLIYFKLAYCHISN